MTAAVTFSPNAECGRKHAYPSKALAKQAARRTESRFAGGRIEFYKCSSCSTSESSMWHVGHRPAPAARRKIQCSACGRTWTPRARYARDGTVLWQLDADLTRCSWHQPVPTPSGEHAGAPSPSEQCEAAS